MLRTVSDFVDLLGSVESTQLAFIFPCAIYLRGAPRYGARIGGAERCWIYYLLLVAALVFVLGTLSSIIVSHHDIAAIWVAFLSRRQRYCCGQEIRHHMATYGEPFSCFCESLRCAEAESASNRTLM